MDALLEPKDYITRSYHAIHDVEGLVPCSVLRPLPGGWETLREDCRVA